MKNVWDNIQEMLRYKESLGFSRRTYEGFLNDFGRFSECHGELFFSEAVVQQRVALGRALIKCADLYLFDEPFCNLDTVLREKLQLDLLSMKHILNAPILFVTHDRREAMVLADQLIVILVCEESYD